MQNLHCKLLVTHLQYTSWPDHGVPAKPEHFLNFVESLRREVSPSEPILVHCSAGVGRTGVTIALDAAISAIEHKIPIDPLARFQTLSFLTRLYKSASGNSKKCRSHFRTKVELIVISTSFNN